MTKALHYSATAKLLHWLIVALLLIQYPLGWLMPDIHRGMTPGAPMNLHISIGLVVLILIIVRLLWRISHPVAPDGDLPDWQRISSEAVHGLLYVLVLATTLTGWMFAAMRGWTVALFWLVPLPPLVAQGSTLGRTLGELHQYIVWALLALVAVHVGAALVHLLVYRDGVVRRMLPGG